jgi:hypothetical protein
MYLLRHDSKQPPTRSLVTVLLAWIFIGSQALLSAGTAYNYQRAQTRTQNASVPWQMMGEGAARMQAIATLANPDTVEGGATFLALTNALGWIALLFGLLSWSRSRHVSGRLTIAAAVVVIWVNSLLSLPYVYPGLVFPG